MEGEIALMYSLDNFVAYQLDLSYISYDKDKKKIVMSGKSRK